MFLVSESIQFKLLRPRVSNPIAVPHQEIAKLLMVLLCRSMSHRSWSQNQDLDLLSLVIAW